MNYHLNLKNFPMKLITLLSSLQTVHNLFAMIPHFPHVFNTQLMLIAQQIFVANQTVVSGKNTSSIMWTMQASLNFKV